MTAPATTRGPAGRVSADGYATGRATSENLIVTAQRLFGERGFDAVSLREISAAAGSRNTGAAQYYFGDKEGLILAIFRRQEPVIAARRRELLAQVSSSADRVRAALRAIIEPLADIAGDGFLTFLAQLQASRMPRGYLQQSDIVATFSQARQTLRELLPELPPRLFDRRFDLVWKLTVVALGDLEWRMARARSVHLDEVVAELVDVTAGMLLARRTTTDRPDAPHREGRR